MANYDLLNDELYWRGLYESLISLHLQKAEKELGPEFKPSTYLERVVAEKINIL